VDKEAANEQVVEADPEVQLQIELETGSMKAEGPHLVPALGAEVLCMGVLRLIHMQRSVLVALGSELLYGVCVRGKSKPGCG